MKKIANIFLILFTSISFFSCEDTYLPPTLDYITFENTSLNLVVNRNTSAEGEIKIYTTHVTSTDRTFNISVTDDSTADPGTYTVPSSVTIPANSNVGSFTISVSDSDASPSGGLVSLKLNSEGNFFTGDKLEYNITRFCPSNLGGVYNVISNGDNTDGQPAAVDVAYTVTITDNGDGQYTISDGFAGVYIYWYSIYGVTFEVEGNFSDSCGNLSGQWGGPFGSTVNLSGNANENGTLTIYWSNGFGDYIDAVYTKQ